MSCSSNRADTQLQPRPRPVGKDRARRLGRKGKTLVNRKHLIALVFALALFVAPAAGAKVLSPDSGGGGLASKASNVPAGMTKAEYRALMIRGAALNARYGNPLTDMSPQQFKKAYEAGIAWANGTAVHESTDSSGSGFDWRYVGIAVLGAMLLAWTSVAYTRRRHQPGF